MGLTVVGLGLLDIAFWFVILNRFDSDGLISITTTMLTFGMGASTQALFARVGGGIYTKAADVGADIVGKVEADIPEDDPRNPATIADNVGDNVGDVAGMGADLYESYCGSILSTAALGASAFATSVGNGMQLKAVIAPMIIAAVGVFLSLLGIFLVRTKEGATMKDLLRSLSFGTNVSAVLIAGASFAILYLLGIDNWLGLSFSVISGLAAFGCRCHHRPGYRVLHLSFLQTDSEDFGGRTDWCGYGHHQRNRHRHDLNMYSCHHDRRGNHAQLFVCQRVRLIHVIGQLVARLVWYRYCRCRYAFNTGYHTGD